MPPRFRGRSTPGSVFNEGSPYTPGPQGTGGAAYNAAGAPSQYDVACFKNKSGGLSPGSAPASTAPTTTAPTPAKPDTRHTTDNHFSGLPATQR